jgi:hypothetical protein
MLVGSEYISLWEGWRLEADMRKSRSTLRPYKRMTYVYASCRRLELRKLQRMFSCRPDRSKRSKRIEELCVGTDFLSPNISRFCRIGIVVSPRGRRLEHASLDRILSFWAVIRRHLW